MNKIIKSIAAIAIGLAAVACSNVDDLADDNKSLAVEGVPASITLDAGGQNMSRVSVEQWTDDMDGTKIDWEWSTNDVIYAISKSTGKYVGRLKFSSWIEEGNKNVATFKTSINEGLKVQDGETIVFWYLGRDIATNDNTFAKEFGIEFPKFDITKAVGDRLTLDFSVQPTSQWGSREIMSANDKIVISNVDGKLQATNKSDLLVMKHHTSFAPTRMWSEKNKYHEHLGYASGSGNGFNFVYKVEVKGAINKAVLDLANERFVSKEVGDVFIWNNSGTGANETFEWTLVPGEQEPSFLFQTMNDVFWEAKLSKYNVPEGVYFVDKTVDEREGGQTRNKMHLICTPLENQPYNINAFGGSGYYTGQDYHMDYYRTLASGNLLYAYDQPKYRFGFQIAKDIHPVSEGAVFASFPFLTSSNVVIPESTPYVGGKTANELIYGNVLPASEISSLNASSWSDIPATWSYNFKYDYSIGKAYKQNRNYFLGFAESINTGRGVKYERLNSEYAVPTIDDFEYLSLMNWAAYVKLSDTGDEGLILTGNAQSRPEYTIEEYQNYYASLLGTSQGDKFFKIAGHFHEEEQPGGIYKGTELDESRMITDISSENIAKSNLTFLPVNPYGYKDFAGVIQHPEWTGLGVYQTSSLNENKKPLGFFFGRSDGKIKIWSQILLPTDYTYVRFISAVYWWYAGDPVTRMWPIN